MARDRVLRVDRERLSGERVGPALIAPLEGNPRQAGDRDRVPGIDRHDLAVEPLGVVDEADPHRSLGLEHEFDHRLSIAEMTWPWIARPLIGSSTRPDP